MIYYVLAEYADSLQISIDKGFVTLVENFEKNPVKKELCVFSVHVSAIDRIFETINALSDKK